MVCCAFSPWGMITPRLSQSRCIARSGTTPKSWQFPPRTLHTGPARGTRPPSRFPRSCIKLAYSATSLTAISQTIRTAEHSRQAHCYSNPGIPGLDGRCDLLERRRRAVRPFDARGMAAIPLASFRAETQAKYPRTVRCQRCQQNANGKSGTVKMFL